MNQLCKVCGEPAAGFHFGAFTCEGCKSFFGRTYNNISSISECKNNGQCVINKKNRTACKACRLRKCLLVGMSKSGSRYGRRSNWFKIHCLLQEQQQQQQQQQQHQQQQACSNMVGAANFLRPHPYLSPLFRIPPITSQHTTRSSDSDSGASSADPEDDLRPNSALSFLKSSASPSSDRDFYANKKLPSSPASDTEFFARKKIVSALNNVPSISPTSLPPSMSPNDGVPKWIPPLQNLADPAAWKDLWRIPHQPVAPGQDQPIDLSVKNQSSPSPVCAESDSENEFHIDVGEEEPLKSVPLDLTLDRQIADVTNC